MTEVQFKRMAFNMDIPYDIVMNLLEKYEINTLDRKAGFFSQCSYESGNFKRLKENLNYSSDRLCVVFKKYFPTTESAKVFHRDPIKIANKVYANRMGNGDEKSGDGWRFKGRGYIQLTGKNNYTKFAEHIGKSIEETIEYLETPIGALESALFYWKIANCNKHCDTKDIKALTKSINGGHHGLEEREKLYNKFVSILQS